MGLQYQHPIYVGETLTLMVSPAATYILTGSIDLPNYSGLAIGSLNASLNKDFNRLFAKVGGHAGYAQNMGGLDTNIKANTYAGGVQGGYRLGERWVSTIYLLSIAERVKGFDNANYQTLGASLSYKIFGRFDLTFSVNKMFGLPDHRFVEGGVGTAWFF
jgi:hypothetical protein